jgi:hypothetical protein
LVSVLQKKGESLREFIERFYNKRNITLEVDDKSIIMFFKKGFRDSSLIRKLAIKNPRTSEEMLAIVNKYAPGGGSDYRHQRSEEGQGAGPLGLAQHIEE